MLTDERRNDSCEVHEADLRHIEAVGGLHIQRERRLLACDDDAIPGVSANGTTGVSQQTNPYANVRSTGDIALGDLINVRSRPSIESCVWV